MICVKTTFSQDKKGFTFWVYVNQKCISCLVFFMFCRTVVTLNISHIEFYVVIVHMKTLRCSKHLNKILCHVLLFQTSKTLIKMEVVYVEASIAFDNYSLFLTCRFVWLNVCIHLWGSLYFRIKDDLSSTTTETELDLVLLTAAEQHTLKSVGQYREDKCRLQPEPQLFKFKSSQAQARCWGCWDSGWYHLSKDCWFLW